MISGRMQIFAIVASVVFLLVMIHLLKQKRLDLKYSLLWLLSGVIMLALAIFPQLLDEFAHLIGIYSAVNALFAVMLFCGIMVMISLTAIISKERREITRLVQEMAMLDNRLRRLEEKLEKKDEPGSTEGMRTGE